MKLMLRFRPTARGVLSLLTFCFFGFQVSSQNLVPNGSFEEGVNCPTGFANLESECLNWYFSLIPDDFFQPTPDWYHTCSENALFTPPNVAYGFKEPYDGGGYAGIGTYDTNQGDSEYKEIMGVELTESLVIGQNYLVEFWVASLLPESSFELIVTNNMGFNFSTHMTYHTNFFPINRTHFSVDTIIGFADNWTQVSVEFEADSAYSFLHIGNFYDDDSTLISSESELAQFSYYVIDAVSVTPILSVNLNRENKKLIKVFPNPTLNELFIEIDSHNHIVYLEIYSQCGKKLYERIAMSSQKLKIHTDFLKPGVYILILGTSKTMYYENFIKI